MTKELQNYGLMEYSPEQNLFQFNEFMYDKQHDAFHLHWEAFTNGWEPICIVSDKLYFELMDSCVSFQDKMFKEPMEGKEKRKREFYNFLIKTSFTEFYNKFLEMFEFQKLYSPRTGTLMQRVTRKMDDKELDALMGVSEQFETSLKKTLEVQKSMNAVLYKIIKSYTDGREH